MAFTAHAGFLGDVGERPVAIVVVESTTKRMRRLVNVGRRGLDEEEVHQPILVIVEPGHTGAHGFQIVFLVGGSGVLLELQTGGLGNVGKGDRNTSRRPSDGPSFGNGGVLQHHPQGCRD